MKPFIAQLIVVVFAISLILITNLGIITASAQSPAPDSISVGTFLIAEDEGQQKPTGIGDYLVRLVNFLASVIGSFAFLALVIGGIILLISGGNDTQVQKGKDIIKYAIIGVVVALSAFFLTAAVQSLFFEYVQ